MLVLSYFSQIVLKNVQGFVSRNGAYKMIVWISDLEMIDLFLFYFSSIIQVSLIFLFQLVSILFYSFLYLDLGKE